jgi:general secretion pathway protein K
MLKRQTISIKKNEDGVAIIFVLWVLVVLSVIAGQFCFSTRNELKAAISFQEQTKAFYIARAGINTSLPGLLNARAAKVDDKQWRINTILPIVDFGDGEYTVFITNESGMVNLNEADKALLHMMLNSLDLDEDKKNVIVDSIMDWRDADSLHRLNGAEDDYYQALPEAYSCADNDFKILSELMLVRGITPRIYSKIKSIVSIQKNENLSREKKSSIQSYQKLENRQSSQGIQQFLTLERRKKLEFVGKQYDYNKININAASALMLMSLPGMNRSLAEKIFEFREKKDFETLNQFKELVGAIVFKGLNSLISLEKSRIYTITSTGRIKGSDMTQAICVTIQFDSENNEYRVLQQINNPVDQEIF